MSRKFIGGFPTSLQQQHGQIDWGSQQGSNHTSSQEPYSDSSIVGGGGGHQGPMQGMKQRFDSIMQSQRHKELLDELEQTKEILFEQSKGEARSHEVTQKMLSSLVKTVGLLSDSVQIMRQELHVARAQSLPQPRHEPEPEPEPQPVPASSESVSQSAATASATAAPNLPPLESPQITPPRPAPASFMSAAPPAPAEDALTDYDDDETEVNLQSLKPHELSPTAYHTRIFPFKSLSSHPPCYCTAGVSRAPVLSGGQGDRLEQ